MHEHKRRKGLGVCIQWTHEKGKGLGGWHAWACALWASTACMDAGSAWPLEPRMALCSRMSSADVVLHRACSKLACMALCSHA
eukprot:360057-Chlamydomonas_euryale.AAC.1